MYLLSALQLDNLKNNKAQLSALVTFLHLFPFNSERGPLTFDFELSRDHPRPVRSGDVRDSANSADFDLELSVVVAEGRPTN